MHSVPLLLLSILSLLLPACGKKAGSAPPPMPPAPDVVPVRDPQSPEHPDPIKEPPTHQPPISTKAK
mgnify:CR=1 FL=1